MTWLGKIMTFMVLIASLVGAYFTVALFVTRTNYKARGDTYKKALEESEANRLSEQRSQEARVAEMSRLLEAERARTAELNANYEKIAADSKKGDDDYKKLLVAASDADVREKLLIASQKALEAEVGDTRKRNNTLEDRQVQLVLDKENAVREQLRAENEKNLQRAVAEEYGRKIETLNALVTELRQSGGSGAATVRTVEKASEPLPDGIRGTVARDISSAGFVQLNIGIDAGLSPGAKLDVYREGEGKYLGTLVIQGTSLRPKEAVASFRPARNVPFGQLRPDELPRKGDTVGIIR